MERQSSGRRQYTCGRRQVLGHPAQVLSPDRSARCRIYIGAADDDDRDDDDDTNNSSSPNRVEITFNDQRTRAEYDDEDDEDDDDNDDSASEDEDMFYSAEEELSPLARICSIGDSSSFQYALDASKRRKIDELGAPGHASSYHICKRGEAGHDEEDSVDAELQQVRLA